MKNTTDSTVNRLVIATGISSVTTQLVCLREFLAQFEGNELVLALFFFCWLVLGGAGTLLARPLGERKNYVSRQTLAVLSLILAVLPGVQILLIRFGRDFFFVHGSSVGFYPVMGYLFVSLTPYCLLLGGILPYSLFVIQSTLPEYRGARIYIMDNLGDVLGGTFFTFGLVFWLTSIQAVICASLPLSYIALQLTNQTFRCRGRAVLFLIGVVGIQVLVLQLDLASIGQSNLVRYRESKFGRLTVMKNEGQHTIFMDNVPLFSPNNQPLAEEMVHYPLSQLESVKQVLLISIETGMIHEIMKYAPRHIDYVEIDQDLTEILQDFHFLPPTPALTIIHADGRTFLKNSDKYYDAIIVCLQEPSTLQTNRFFTDRFFQLVKSRLTRSGVFSFSVSGYENYISESHQKIVSALYNTALKHFSQILLIPGQKIYFICGQQNLTTDIPSLLARKGIPTDYIAYYFTGNVTRERMDDLNKSIDPSISPNQDTSPKLLCWVWNQWFEKFYTSPVLFVGILCGFCFLYLLTLSRGEWILFSTGFSLMAGEIILIMAVQIFYGFIYYKIGVIVTVFLAGLLPGALLSHRLESKSPFMIRMIDGGLILIFSGFIVGIGLEDRLPESIYLMTGFLISFLGGCQFPLVLKLLGEHQKGVTHSFSADLMGAGLGVLLTSVVLIPFGGMRTAVITVILVKLLSLGTLRGGA